MHVVNTRFTSLSVSLEDIWDFFFNGPNPFIFRCFSHDKYNTNLTINYKSVYGVLGTQTRGGRMVGADESTAMAAPPRYLVIAFWFISAYEYVPIPMWSS